MKKFEKAWQEKMDRLSDRQFRGTALVIVVVVWNQVCVVQICFVILRAWYSFVRQHGGCGPASLMVGNPLISTP